MKAKKITPDVGFIITPRFVPSTTPGNWEVSPSFGSRQAYLFWENVIGTYTDGNYRYEDGVFIFDSRISTQNQL